MVGCNHADTMSFGTLCHTRGRPWKKVQQRMINVNVNLYYGAVNSRLVNDDTEAPGTPWSAEGSLKQMSLRVGVGIGVMMTYL
jgi:hypothetical protein